MVTNGSPVTITGNGADSLLPPVTRSSEGLFYVGPQTVTSGGPISVPGSEASVTVTKKNYAQPLGPLGFDFAQHRQTLRPTVDGIL